MITEDYVSFELAKLLKEKGFNEQGRDFYRQEDDEWFHRNTYAYNYFNTDVPRWENCYACPTLQTVMNWLRKKYNLFIQITVNFSDGAYPMYDAYAINLAICTFYTIYGYDRYDYKQAVEKSIKYCLKNLI